MAKRLSLQLNPVVKVKNHKKITQFLLESLFWMLNSPIFDCQIMFFITILDGEPVNLQGLGPGMSSRAVSS